jgi:hypothetical protein
MKKLLIIQVTLFLFLYGLNAQNNNKICFGKYYTYCLLDDNVYDSYESKTIFKKINFSLLYILGDTFQESEVKQLVKNISNNFAKAIFNYGVNSKLFRKKYMKTFGFTRINLFLRSTYTINKTCEFEIIKSYNGTSKYNSDKKYILVKVYLINKL